MTRKRRTHSPEFKSKVALAAIQGDLTMAEMVKKFDVHANQITEWKKQLLGGAPDVFGKGAKKAENTEEAVQALHAKIGQLTMENDFLERGARTDSRAQRKEMVDRSDPLPVSRQCELLALPRSTFYHVPEPVSEEELELMRRIDRCHLKHPYYGSRRIRDWLEDEGYRVNRKRVQRLMRTMGLVALYPKRNLSLANQAHKVYPYLLRGLTIDRPNQVWATDITYIPMARGFIYLVAVMDWYSRRVLSWRVSNTLDTSFCIEALEEAIENHGAPEIFNTDQGSQFTSEEFADVLKQHDIQISMDGKGRWVDNVFVERLWRSVKYEEVYLKAYDSIGDARDSLSRYFVFYNSERRHQSLDRRTPDSVYYQDTVREAA
ncbi:MAG: IS3 family transposase [Gammaproteobacteria bacterium]|nr:IS3 family transposase [Gammaproteobacteria bacterium]MCW8840230.1 IS3 family transposase [Gammaproteobacteria bacterium]MCW8958770.1 IS3 family transposase [Gammaproteobacteria bacterium]MCW8973181.1 IS3 family transposase [Gammaproteobacteria bacterium]MCW8991929.1 IS3 family transposase [Gammaproteobacteria bacterium]